MYLKDIENDLENMLGDDHPELTKVKTAFAFEKSIVGDDV